MGLSDDRPADGEEALLLAEREDWRFGSIVTDQRLGAGWSGVEAAKEILRRSGRALPTLVLTGDTAGEAIAEIGASGFELMLKPIAAEPLRPALARLMGARDPPSRRRSGSAVGQRAGS